MYILTKYAVANHVYVPQIKRSVVDFAISADWTPATGDVKISIDGGAAANVTNLPVAITMGNVAIWDFSLTSGELTGKKIVITVGDSATKAVEDNCFILGTYGNASAEYVADLSDGVRLGLTSLPNAVAGANGGLPLGDASGRIDLGRWIGSTPSALSSTYVQVDAEQWKGGTIPAVNVTGVPKTDVVDWLGSAPNALISGRVDSTVGAMQNAVVTAASIAASALNGKGDWSTTTGIWQDLLAGADFSTVGSIGKLLKDDIDAAISSRSTLTAGAQMDLVNAPNATALTAIVAAINAAFVEGTLTKLQYDRIMLSSSAGITNGAGTGTFHTRDQGNTKNRITASTDGSGNRTAMAVDGT